jgi:ATP-dependent protease ClpP protease subunit
MKYDGNVFFIGDFDPSMEDDILIPLTREIQRQRIREEGRIDLHINSAGGNFYLMQHLVNLVDLAKRSGVVVRTMVFSMAYSAGSMLAITGTPGERYIARGAEHLIHYGSNGGVNTTPVQAKRQAMSNERAFRYNVRHYKKYANVPNLEQHISDDNFYVTAAEAIKWGLADEYLEKLDIGYLDD